MMSRRSNRMPSRGGTLADLILLLAASCLLASSLLPTIASYRAAARASTCMNNLTLMGLAVHNYHAAYDRLPGCGIGTNAGSAEEPLRGNGMRLSVFVGILPFNEQHQLWEKISNPLVHDGTRFHAMGPYPTFDPKKYPPWAERPSFLVCPSDKAAGKYTMASSYVVNYGDGILDVGAPLEPNVLPPYGNDQSTRRGVFAFQKKLGFRDVLDGLSNTVMFSEAKYGGTISLD